MMTIPMAISLAIAFEQILIRQPQDRQLDKVSNNLRAFTLFAIVFVLLVNAYHSYTIFHMNPRINEVHNGMASVDNIIKSFYQQKSFFLPKEAKSPALLLDHPLVKSLNSEIQIKIIKWKIAERRFEITAQRETLIALRTYYYPGWRGEYILNGDSTPIELKTDPDNGRILVTVPAGNGIIHIYFDTTHGRKIGIILSCLTIVACFLILLFNMKRRI